MVVEAAVARAIAAILHGIADSLLWVADLLTGGARWLLRWSRFSLDRAREWDPRRWARGEDPRNDARERRP